MAPSSDLLTDGEAETVLRSVRKYIEDLSKGPAFSHFTITDYLGHGELRRRYFRRYLEAAKIHFDGSRFVEHWPPIRSQTYPASHRHIEYGKTVIESWRRFM
jgi:hypothetical protein